MPGVRQIGRRRFVRNLPLNRSVRWTQSSPLTGGVLHACPEYRAWRLPVPRGPVRDAIRPVELVALKGLLDLTVFQPAQ